jgi:hypothetical protein
MMKSIEAGGLELLEARRNDAAPSLEAISETMAELDVQAVGQEMPAAESASVADQVVEVQSDGRIVRGNHGAGADADHRVDPNAVIDETAQDADMRSAAQPARAENQTDTNRCRHAATSAAAGSTDRSQF